MEKHQGEFLQAGWDRLILWGMISYRARYGPEIATSPPGLLGYRLTEIDLSSPAAPTASARDVTLPITDPNHPSEVILTVTLDKTSRRLKLHQQWA